jgi:beta-glucosidase
MDNYEWGSYTPTFGLYRVDRDDPLLQRKATPAADVYRRIARDNGVPTDLLERYLYRRS